MDIFDKRKLVLNLQEAMLTNKTAKKDDFLSLVAFENWCCNSGLSGFAQDFKESDLLAINNFGIEQKFSTITKMVLTVQKYLDKYGKDFIDIISEEEHEDLSQYDNEFYDIHDRYTDAIYKKYIDLTSPKLPNQPFKRDYLR